MVLDVSGLLDRERIQRLEYRKGERSNTGSVVPEEKTRSLWGSGKDGRS